MKEKLQEKIQVLLNEVTYTIEEIQKNNLQNEQFALDFVDELNRLSVSF